jgi:hypothetical protein
MSANPERFEYAADYKPITFHVYQVNTSTFYFKKSEDGVSALRSDENL